MVETGVGGSDQEAGCGEQRGRQNGTENQSLKAQLRGREGKGEIRIMSSGSRRARQGPGVNPVSSGLIKREVRKDESARLRKGSLKGNHGPSLGRTE